MPTPSTIQNQVGAGTALGAAAAAAAVPRRRRLRLRRRLRRACAWPRPARLLALGTFRRRLLQRPPSSFGRLLQARRLRLLSLASPDPPPVCTSPVVSPRRPAWSRMPREPISSATMNRAGISVTTSCPSTGRLETGDARPLERRRTGPASALLLRARERLRTAAAAAPAARSRRQRRHQVGLQLGEDDHVADVERGEHDPGEERARVELDDRDARGGAVDDQHHRRRDQDAEATARGDGARGDLDVVAGAQHRRQREQAHQRHHRADDAGGGGEDRAGDDASRPPATRECAPARGAGS